MKAYFFTVFFCWVLLCVLQALSIPVENPTPIKEELVGSTVTCNDHEYKPNGKNYCCNKCHAGYRVAADCLENGQTKCVPCEEETFLDSSNYSPWCEACNECLMQNGQIELTPCAKDKDVQCGCPAGQFKRGKYPGDPNFVCEECNSCQNGTILHQCSVDMDTICQCNSKFFFDKSDRKCHHCTECDSPDCEPNCPRTVPVSTKDDEKREVLWIVVGVAAVMACLGAAACVVQYIRKKSPSLASPDITGDIKYTAPSAPNSSKPEHRHLLPGYATRVGDSCHVLEPNLEQVQKPGLPMPDITERTPRHHSPKVLYAIIECVPVRHWREFVRRLGLSEHIIDTAEEDYRYYKDTQHRMLQAWTHLEGSSLDQLYRVLREMNLGGCVEKIEERIEERIEGRL